MIVSRFSMRLPDITRPLRLVAIFLGFLAVKAAATTYYVDVNSTDPTPPYTSWATASTDIQSAIDVSMNGDLILVNPGIYETGGRTVNGYVLTNRVVIDQAVTVESVGGPSETIIEGYQVPGTTNGNSAVRCVYMTNNAVLIGFTLTNGATRSINNIEDDPNKIDEIYHEASGGGVWCEDNSAIVSNCVISANAADFIQVGKGGGAFEGTLNNCLVNNNSCYQGAVFEGVLSNCTLLKNSAVSGGAAFGGVFNNCLLAGNSASFNGGAVAAEISYGASNYPVVLDNCVISNNTAELGGGVWGTEKITNCILNNCLLAFNRVRQSSVGTEIGGGAVLAELNNCVISNNSTPSIGVSYGGGVEGGLLNNCILTGNSAAGGGGADGRVQRAPVLNNCILVANSSTNGLGGGAGYSILNQCTILDSFASEGGGVAYCSINDSLIISNSCGSGGEGGGAYDSSLTNCILTYNYAPSFGDAAYRSTLVNCVVTTNMPGGGAVDFSAVFNSIIYGNYNASGRVSNWNPNTFSALNFCCTYPMSTTGFGNITNDPAFVNPVGGNYHLQSNSPCINSGNNAYIFSPTDLDGNPRIVGGTVDIGAYEYQTPTSVISYAYLQQYGLPTDGSVDYADLDGTPFNVYQDWIAGLNPTNPASVLMMLSPPPANNASGVTVSWESVSGINYNLLRTTSLTSPWTTIQANIIGQAGTTSYTDMTATNGGPYFYQVAVP